MLFYLLKGALLHGKRAPFTTLFVTIYQTRDYKPEKERFSFHSAFSHIFICKDFSKQKERQKKKVPKDESFDTSHIFKEAIPYFNNSASTVCSLLPLKSIATILPCGSIRMLEGILRIPYTLAAAHSQPLRSDI